MQRGPPHPRSAFDTRFPAASRRHRLGSRPLGGSVALDQQRSLISDEKRERTGAECCVLCRSALFVDAGMPPAELFSTLPTPGRAEPCWTSGRERACVPVRGGASLQRESRVERRPMARTDDEEEEAPSCPLCLEELDATDLAVRACQCGYQVRLVLLGRAMACPYLSPVLLNLGLPLVSSPYS